MYTQSLDIPGNVQSLGTSPDANASPEQQRFDAVMQADDALVEVVHTLKQVVCVKG